MLYVTQLKMLVCLISHTTKKVCHPQTLVFRMQCVSILPSQRFPVKKYFWGVTFFAYFQDTISVFFGPTMSDYKYNTQFPGLLHSSGGQSGKILIFPGFYASTIPGKIEDPV